MKILVTYICTVLVISVRSTTVLDEHIYKTNSLIYTAENDIVDIHSSIIDASIDLLQGSIVFIVERQLPNGSFKGLYALKADEKNTLISTKVLDNGNCITSDNITVFFGASDGIYTYNFKARKAEKYGNITADIKSIQKHSNKDVIYVVADGQLSEVTEKGTNIKKVESVNNVQEIILDKYNNVYFYEKLASSDESIEAMSSKPKVIVDGKITNIKDLPDNFNQLKLTRSYASSEGVILFLDNRLYRIFPNGTSDNTDYIFENAPTAYYMYMAFIQFFARGQNLYHLNIIKLYIQGLGSVIEDFIKRFDH